MARDLFEKGSQYAIILLKMKKKNLKRKNFLTEFFIKEKIQQFLSKHFFIIKKNFIKRKNLSRFINIFY